MFSFFKANRWLAVHTPLTSPAHATALHQANDPVDLLPRRTMNAANSPPQLLLCPSTRSSIPDQQTSLMPSGSQPLQRHPNGLQTRPLRLTSARHRPMFQPRMPLQTQCRPRPLAGCCPICLAISSHEEEKRGVGTLKKKKAGHLREEKERSAEFTKIKGESSRVREGDFCFLYFFDSQITRGF